jgi:hypothetical protein
VRSAEARDQATLGVEGWIRAAASLLAALAPDVDHALRLVRGAEARNSATLSIEAWTRSATSLLAAWHLLNMQNTNSINLYSSLLIVVQLVL